MATQPGVTVEGFAGLRRAFAAASKAEARGLTKALKDAAEPVRADADANVPVRIPRAGIAWSRMRVGISRGSVYVVPRERGARHNPARRRPRFKDLMLDRAMIPALEENTPEAVGRVDQLLAEVGRVWETTR